MRIYTPEEIKAVADAFDIPEEVVSEDLLRSFGGQGVIIRHHIKKLVTAVKKAIKKTLDEITK